MTIYPQTDNSSCVAILLSNLADPEWITINCNEPMTTDVVCYFEHINYKKKPTVINIVSDTKIHETACVLINNTCYLFKWIGQNYKKQLQNIVNNVSDVKIFQHLYDAVDVLFPPILSRNLDFKISYIRYGVTYEFKETKITQEAPEGLIISKNDPHDFHMGGNIFNCSMKFFISFKFVCDGKYDCGGYNSADEIDCHCQSFSPKCKYLGTNLKENRCSYFYFKTKNNVCEKYELTPKTLMDVQASIKKINHVKENLFNLKLPSDGLFNFASHKYDNIMYFLNGISSKTNLKEVFSCTNGLVLSNIIVNDIVSDCGSEADDEDLLQSLALGKVYSCKYKDQIPCVQGHSRCYDISDICSSRLNEMNYLEPCRTGELIQNCKHFKCNMMYKCPEYYCIPWSYVCDKKWDCPHGYDEKNCDKNEVCSSKYRCRNSQKCIHLNDICNSIDDCLLGDDEYFCSLHETNCPSMYQCFTFAIRCYNIQSQFLLGSDSLPYYIIHIENCTEIFTKTLFTHVQTIASLVVIRNNLQSICDAIPLVGFVYLCGFVY